MSNPLHGLGALVLVLGLLAVGPSTANDEVAQQGLFVGLSQDRVVITDAAGRIFVYTALPETAITVDGQEARTSDLRPGMRIQVATTSDNLQSAVRIEATTVD